MAAGGRQSVLPTAVVALQRVKSEIENNQREVRVGKCWGQRSERISQSENTGPQRMDFIVLTFAQKTPVAFLIHKQQIHLHYLPSFILHGR